jgi:uncharacterized SAM-binding protein YcdF (DUF218 family)
MLIAKLRSHHPLVYFVMFTTATVGVIAVPTFYSLLQLQLNRKELKSAILVLGGRDIYRERRAFELATALDREANTEREKVPVWVSKGNDVTIYALAAEYGLDKSRIEIDNRAMDTVTNFTTLAPRIHEKGVTRVYVVTNSTHINRAMAIAQIVLGYYGVAATAIPSGNQINREEEWATSTWRDYLRSVLWFYTGITGARLEVVKNWLRSLNLSLT